MAVEEPQEEDKDEAEIRAMEERIRKLLTEYNDKVAMNVCSKQELITMQMQINIQKMMLFAMRKTLVDKRATEA